MMEIIAWLLKNWKLVASAVLVAGAFASGWVSGGDSVRRDWEVDIHIRTKAQLAALEANQKRITELEVTKNANLEKVRALNRELATYRVSMPTCEGSGQTPATGGGAATSSGAGALSAELQGALDEFTAGVASDFDEADRVVESCRVVMEWAKSSGSCNAH